MYSTTLFQRSGGNPFTTPTSTQPVSEVDEVKRGKTKTKLKKIKRVWKALFGNRGAGEKYTEKTSSSEGEKKDQGADAAVLQSRRNTNNQISSVQGLLQDVACTELASDVDRAKGGRKKEKCEKSIWKVLFGCMRPSKKVLQTPPCTVVAQNVDTLQAPGHTINNQSVDAKQTPVQVESDWSVEAQQAPAQQAPAQVESDWSVDAQQAPAQVESEWSADAQQAPAQVESEWSADAQQAPAQQAPAQVESDWSVDAQQPPAQVESDWSVDAQQAPAQQAPAQVESDWSLDAQQAPAQVESDWSVDAQQAPAQQAPAQVESDWSLDAQQAPAQVEYEWSTDAQQAPAQQAPAQVESDWSVDALQGPVPAVSDWSADILQTPGHTKSLFDPCSDIFSYYEVGNMLGQGGFGAVYEGRRVKDGLEVAVKFVKKTEHMHYISFPEPLPLEVALLILVNEGPRVPQIIQLLDWKDVGEYCIMILERPIPCEDLFDFVQRHGGRIDEELARVVMQQTTQAAYMSCQRGVLHRDIKKENILINKDTLEVKLIDFGCGDLLQRAPYTTFRGTRMYCPPEFISEGKYHGEPATVYSLGVLLFSLVCGTFPDNADLIMINRNRWCIAGLSLECCQLICSCLQREPAERLDLAKILHHEWFKGSDMKKFGK